MFWPYCVERLRQMRRLLLELRMALEEFAPQFDMHVVEGLVLGQLDRF